MDKKGVQTYILLCSLCAHMHVTACTSTAAMLSGDA